MKIWNLPTDDDVAVPISNFKAASREYATFKLSENVGLDVDIQYSENPTLSGSWVTLSTLNDVDPAVNIYAATGNIRVHVNSGTSGKVVAL